MVTRYVSCLAIIILLSFGGAVAGADDPKPWMTSLAVASNTTLRLRWIQQYEGYETVKRIDAVRGGKVVKTFQMSGQPVFNQAKTYLALPDCWHGGCSTDIRILDLVGLTELPPIRFDREWFFKVVWDSEKELRVVLGAMNEKEKTEIRCFAVRSPQPSNRPLEPTGCAGGSAPSR